MYITRLIYVQCMRCVCACVCFITCLQFGRYHSEHHSPCGATTYYRTSLGATTGNNTIQKTPRRRSTYFAFYQVLKLHRFAGRNYTERKLQPRRFKLHILENENLNNEYHASSQTLFDSLLHSPLVMALTQQPLLWHDSQHSIQMYNPTT